VDGTAPTTVTRLDPGGLALLVTNPLGGTVANGYDIHGRLVNTSFGNEVNRFAYDAAGNRTSVIDGNNQETTFGYDGLNRLTWQTFANGDTTSYTYDAVRKLSQTSPRGITTSYTYDSRDRVIATSANDLNRTHTYDAAGHLLTVTEPGNPTANVSYTYDALGRVLTETSRGVQHAYSYDLAGNRVRADYGTGRSVQTSYDALNRPESLVEGDRATRYGYDLGGRAVILMTGNGQVTSNSYDALGRLTDRTLYRTQAMSGGDTMAQFAWQHDLLGNVTNQSETWPGEPSRTGTRTTSMAYDGNNRLTTETVTDPTAGVTTTAYAYDNANNRVRKQVTGGADPGAWAYNYNSANQLTNWEQRDSPNGTLLKSAALAYDDSGNRISQNVNNLGGSSGSGINPLPAAGGTTTYQWDAQDRLSSVTLPNGTQHAYNYDYRTRRIGTQQLVSGAQQAQTAIVFAGGLSLAEYDLTNSQSSSIEHPASSTVHYVRGPDMGGGVGGMLYSIRAGTTKYSLSNGRGDIVAQADSSATLTWTASYEAYGRRSAETGSNADKQRGNSKDEDPTGLLNEGFRYRDLETGVWLSRDPAGFVDGPNVYAYVKQNPWTGWDPHGLQEEKKQTNIASHEVEPSSTDVRLINGVYNLSDSARVVYNQAHDFGYRVQIMEKGTVGRMNNDPNAIATVRKEAKTIFVETTSSSDVPDLAKGTAVFHEAFHIVQEEYAKNPNNLSPAARELIESVRYQEDSKVPVSPNELEVKRVQNIIIQEVGAKTQKTPPLLKTYDGQWLPKGTEMGRGWSPPSNVPNNKPPLPAAAKPNGNAQKNEKEKTK
jgi:RHS repeat-associated protein